MKSQPVKKNVRSAAADHGPFLPAHYEISDVAAIQALLAGTADQYQQQRALKWIIEVACGTYDLSFRPGAQEGERDTTFAEGRRFVGLNIVKLTRLNVSRMRSNENVVS